MAKERQEHAPSSHHLDRRVAPLIAAGEGAGDDLLSTREVAEWFGVSVQWLEIGRSKNYGPPFLRLGPQRIRYQRTAVLRWLEGRRFNSTSEYPRAGGRPRGSGRAKQQTRAGAP